MTRALITSCQRFGRKWLRQHLLLQTQANQKKKKQVTKSPDPLLDDISYIIYGSTVLTWSGEEHTQFFFSEKQVNIYVKNLMICTFWLSVEMLQKLILCEVGCAFLLRNQKFHLFSRETC